MKKNVSRLLICLTIFVMLTGIISCGKGNSKEKENVNTEENQKAEKKDETVQQEEEKGEDDEIVAKGIDKEFITDGKLHEEKFLNKRFSYPDSGDSFKIEKDESGYFITEYIDESPILEKTVPIKEEKSRLELYKDVYLIHEGGVFAYAYDTELKNVVILNTDNNFRIINEAEELKE
ncbi:MAG: pantothenate kinase [Leptotrichiaceae bacterium]|nr:pantothenate kinase [Leptotrichiaceae bacterium]